MNDAQSQILNVIWNAYAMGYSDGRNCHIPIDLTVRLRGSTDQILALIDEAMLSSNALRAAVDVIDDRTGYHEQEYAHDTISAALAAAGITPGDAREGGE